MRVINAVKTPDIVFAKYEGQPCRVMGQSDKDWVYGILHVTNSGDVFILQTQMNGNRPSDNWREKYGLPVSFQLSDAHTSWPERSMSVYGVSKLEIYVKEDENEHC